MTRRAKQALQAIPLLQHDPVFLGIDVGKAKHMAGFVSRSLLEQHQRFEACPALAFENSRKGFQTLVERMRALAPLEHYAVLLEKTGHYHKALQQFLQELDIPVLSSRERDRLCNRLGLVPSRWRRSWPPLARLRIFPTQVASTRILDGLPLWFSPVLSWIPPGKRVEAHAQ